MADIEYIRKTLNYDPLTGLFSKRGGTPVGGITSQGYIAIGLNYRRYLAHRLAFVCMLGRWPEQQVDHINRIRIDNQWCNLREVNASQNASNRGANTNKVLPRGVFKQGLKFRSKIKIKGKQTHLGYFNSPEEAEAALQKKYLEVYGEYAPKV